MQFPNGDYYLFTKFGLSREIKNQINDVIINEINFNDDKVELKIGERKIIGKKDFTKEKTKGKKTVFFRLLFEWDNQRLLLILSNLYSSGINLGVGSVINSGNQPFSFTLLLLRKEEFDRVKEEKKEHEAISALSRFFSNSPITFVFPDKQSTNEKELTNYKETIKKNENLFQDLFSSENHSYSENFEKLGSEMDALLGSRHKLEKEKSYTVNTLDYPLTSIRILADRVGSIMEITSYLQDLENAYNALYVFDEFLSSIENSFQINNTKSIYLTIKLNPKLDTSRHLINPEYLLTISKVNIQSEGFWELIGALNPLQQLREYLKDRHERRKDIEWKEPGEKERGILERQLLLVQITEGENKVLSEKIKILKEIGFTNEEIRELIWKNIGKDLMQLGKHQDNGIIKGSK